MRIRDLALSMLAVLVYLPALQADDGSGSDDEASRVAWLKKHVTALRPVDLQDDDDSDLEPIRKAIGDARIVFLGEELHGVGNTFRLRSRLIKYLHEKCDFDVLAFESGLYDCRKVWQVLREGKMSPRDAVGQGVFDIWAGTEELQPMFRYLAKQAGAPKPLEVCGFDCQFSGPASKAFLPDDLASMLKTLPPEALTAQQRDTIAVAFRKLARPGTGIDKSENDALVACRKVLGDTEPGKSLTADDLAFWRQFLDSALAMADVETAIKEHIKTERNSINLRDAQMARNLVWLAHKAYPKCKIIVWAASFHLMRNCQTVGMVTEPGKTPAERKTVMGYAESKIETMGGAAWKDLSSETYSIFFTAAEGEFQDVHSPKPQKLAPLVQGSLEDLLVKAGSENCFLDFRQRGKEGTWLEERLVARVLGDMDHEADWTKVCDGFVFIKRQAGVTPVKMETLGLPYVPVRDPQKLDVPYDRYTTGDSLGRTITFYLSIPPDGSKEKLPVAVWVQGAGCASVFPKREGKIESGLQDLLRREGKGKVRVLVVEKPGVSFGALPKNPDSAEEAGAEFRREYTLPRWVEAVNAAIRAAHRLEDVDWKRTLVVGYSEGAIVAANVAAANPLVSHLALLAGGGPSQLVDLIELAGRARPSDRSSASAQARVDEIRRGWSVVTEDPDNADKFWLGQTHRRWSSYLKSSTLQGVLGSRAVVFAAQGTADQTVPVSSFDLLCNELSARRRELESLRLDGRDHQFRKPDDAADDFRGMQETLGKVASWFQDKRGPIEKSIKADADRMQGRWLMVLSNRDGDVDARAAAAKLIVEVEGEQRKLRSGDAVLAQSCFRINPAAEPPTIDLIVNEGRLRGQILLGIYELDGDRWRVCLAAPGRDRPRDFNPRPGSGQSSQELERAIN